MATYLITGVAGFIGSALARAVLAQGDKVRGVDNLSSGKHENLEEIINRVDFREADVLDLEALHEACEGVDYVMHQAAIPSVPKSVVDPLGNNAANVDGTVNVLVAARDAKVKRVTFAASSAAYGDAPGLPKRENMLPSPISPYAVGKLASEYYLSSFYRCYGLETVALRYFNVFGPRQDPQVAIFPACSAKFTTQMIKGEQPTVFGDGKQSRDFVYVDNVVHANLLACKAPAAEVAGKVFNVGIGKRVDLIETFEVLKKLTGFKGGLKFAEKNDPPDEKHSVARHSLIKKQLGYVPQVDFEGAGCVALSSGTRPRKTQLRRNGPKC